MGGSRRAVDNSPVFGSETTVSYRERTEEFLSKCQATLEVVVPNNNQLPVRARLDSLQNKPDRVELNRVNSTAALVYINSYFYTLNLNSKSIALAVTVIGYCHRRRFFFFREPETIQQQKQNPQTTTITGKH